VTKESLACRLKEGSASAFKVYELAKEKGVPVHHAFFDYPNHGIPPALSRRKKLLVSKGQIQTAYRATF
jgi:hypothetical protein